MRNEMYVPVGPGDAIAVASLSEATYETAVTYQGELQQLALDEWTGQLRYELDVFVTDDSRDAPTLLLEVQDDTIRVVERGYEGVVPVRFYENTITEPGPLFSGMLLYYVFDDGPRCLSEEDVQAVLQSQAARKEWDAIVASAKADANRYSDA